MHNSIQKYDSLSRYGNTESLKKNDKINKSNAFMKVPIAPRIAGKKILSILNIFFKRPVKKPIMVLSKEFNPNGAAERKSTRNPVIKPWISPAEQPLKNEI